jgi:prepilin-type processing-associated H-X9-DG protein
MLVVIAIIGILAALLLPALNGGKQRATRIVCGNQLQQIGMGFQNFAHDHNSKFPMLVATNDGGALEYLQAGEAAGGTFDAGYRNFQSLAGTLQTPRILVCPADTRTPAADFASLQNSNLSYFAATSASYDQPMSILSGDGNLASSATVLQAGAGGRLTWNRRLHQFKGNVLFSDGHVEEWKDLGGSTLGGSVTIILPTTGGGGGGGGGSLGGGQGPAAAAAAQLGAADWQNGATNASPATNNGIAPPPPPPVVAVKNEAGGTHPRTGIITTPGTMTRTTARQSAEETSEVAGDAAAATNAPATNTASVAEVAALMSPGNQEIARVLRDFLGGTYITVLLLLLLYAAYRYLRWKQKQMARRSRD